ncbi:hypothetical protein EVA_08647 [gut metagenome]|uniref:Uncharacterized protein n=1 Tax=gut metagenome TaxID=749906 RepID=J9GM06_9ZZZZ
MDKEIPAAVARFFSITACLKTKLFADWIADTVINIALYDPYAVTATAITSPIFS